MMILIAGFFGLFTLFINVSCVIRSIAISTFVLCFFSNSPYITFTSYVSIVLCCYFYILCKRIEDWKIIVKVLQTLLLLNLVLLILQYFGMDSLLNYGLGRDITGFGIIGHHMQMGSFSVVLSAILLPFNAGVLLFPLLIAFLCHSVWTLIPAVAGGFVFLYKSQKKLAQIILVVGGLVFGSVAISQHKFEENLAKSGRAEVWQTALSYSNHHPFVGWGAGSFKVLFPAFNLQPERYTPYKNAHNSLIQLIFEMGYPFAGFIFFMLGNLIWRLYKAGETRCAAGLTMILLDSMVHFPDRMMQTVPLIICFLAYCEIKLAKKVSTNPIQNT